MFTHSIHGNHKWDTQQLNIIKTVTLLSPSPCISDPFYFALLYFLRMYLLTYHISYAPYMQGTMRRLLIYPSHQNNTWVMICTKEIVVEGLELGSPKSNERTHGSKHCTLSMRKPPGWGHSGRRPVKFNISALTFPFCPLLHTDLQFCRGHIASSVGSQE